MKSLKIILYVSRINFFIGLTMLAPIALSYVNNEKCLIPFIESFLLICILFGTLSMLLRSKSSNLSNKDGWLIASLGWLVVGLSGALPFFLSHTFGIFSFENYINCFFESISGFTTTGASVLGSGSVPIESLDHGLLLWRSLTHWLGGLGILVFVIAILPSHAGTSDILFRSETSAFNQHKIKPRTREVAKTLWLIYISITILGTCLLMFGGLSMFEAFCNAVGAVATGGYSTRDSSIGAFNSLYVEIVIMGLMIFGATSFSLHYNAMVNGVTSYWKNGQFKWHLSIMIFGVVAIVMILYFNGTYASIFDCMRYGSFQAISILSTTGFSTAAFGLWPYAAQLLLVIFMFIGGMVGSTSGAIKTARVIIIAKYVYREFLKIIHPKIFSAIKIDKKVIPRSAIERVMGFFFLYILTFVIGTTAITACGIDIVSAFSSVATTMGGVGPGLGVVRASSNFFAIPVVAKCILIFCMIIGRLEIFAVFSLFMPFYWRK